MTTVDYVDSKFNGRPVRFRLGPRALDWFETLHGSASATLRRFTTSGWTIADLRAVLGSSHPRRHRGAEAEIAAAIAANRPATFAPLAVLILAAALAGIPEKDARFDESD